MEELLCAQFLKAIIHASFFLFVPGSPIVDFTASPDTGQACAFLRDTKGNGIGIFSRLSGCMHGKYVCDPRSNHRTTKKGEGERGKESWRKERKKGRELKINKK